MNILYLHQYFRTPEGAGGTRSFELARRLVARGHRVEMIASDPRPGAAARRTIAAGINVTWLPVPYSNSMSYAERMRAFSAFMMKSTFAASGVPNIDIVFATSTPLTIAIPGVVCSKLRRVPMVFEVRDLWPEVPIEMGALKHPLLIWVARRLESFAYRNSAAIVALSPGMAAGVAKTGFPADRIVEIPNFSDVDRFQVPREAGEEFRARYPQIPDGPIVLYAGTLGEANGVPFLAEIASAARTWAPELRFVVVGDGKQAELTRRRAQELGVLDSTFFMLGRVPKDEMPAVMSAATICTSLFIDKPSLLNNSANKFFDSLAAGRPIAINYGGWQADLVRENGIGVVLERDPIEAARALGEFCASPDAVLNAGQRALEIARERFSADLAAEKLESTLLDAIQRATSRK